MQAGPAQHKIEIRNGGNLRRPVGATAVAVATAGGAESEHEDAEGKKASSSQSALLRVGGAVQQCAYSFLR